LTISALHKAAISGDPHSIRAGRVIKAIGCGESMENNMMKPMRSREIWQARKATTLPRSIKPFTDNNTIIGQNDRILVTGANGFIGSRVVETLLSYGFRNLRCLVRPSSMSSTLNEIIHRYSGATVETIEGNLLSRSDCNRATEDVSLIINLVAGIEKSFPGCFMNSVLTMRNLLESAVQHDCLKRFLHVSSFSVYSNVNLKRGGLLDETCGIEDQFMERFEAYCYGKVKQEVLLKEYGKKYDIPFVIVRPGAVYGPGKSSMTARIGIDTFGMFLHLGGPNLIPLTYVDNCADAIMLAGIIKGVDGEVFNIVDDELPKSRTFLRMYKSRIGPMRSVYIPYTIFYCLCYLWETYSEWSKGQVPPVFNRRKCSAYWKRNAYSNDKLKNLLGWEPRVSFVEASNRYFEYIAKSGSRHA
jgi:nucleoside-diphosphate-sugar epimerase